MTYNKNFNFKSEEIIENKKQKYFSEDLAVIKNFKTADENLNYLEQKLMEKTPVVGIAVKRDNEKNLIIELGNNIKGIIPFEEISINEGERDANSILSVSKIGKKVYGIITSIDIDKKEVILSRKEAMKYIRNHIFSTLEPKMKTKGVVVSIKDKTTFIDLGGEILGIIPLENLAQTFTFNAEDRVNVGDIIEVAVVKKKPKRYGVVLTRKELINKGWDDIEERYEENSIVIGVVKKEQIVRTVNGPILFYIVELDENVEAMFSPRNKLKYKLKPKDKVKVSIKKIVPKLNKIEGFILDKVEY